MKLLFISTGIILVSAIVLFAQDNEKKSRKDIRAGKRSKIEQKVKEIITSRDYIFYARQANPLGGSPINLTSEYTLQVKGDTIESFLPFYGVAYRAELHGEGGIKFNTTAKNYKVKEKKGRYEVSIKVNAPNDDYRLYLVVTSSGYATLNVNCNNRQSISFNGIIKGVGL
ncbi:hypothetical protein MNBD_BACTEROID01-1988 [hydrothermal vent metagenome]|uniref:DUF4251 domain-containing protein n=1 Tax=hydrothermal vent metagenome TaxID=652676 RepID=A0A3B0TXX8_9ZZZZ